MAHERSSNSRAAMKVLITDYDFPDLELERGLFAAAGIEMAAAQCRSEQAVIDAAAGCSALLVQYAPVSDRVLAALPQVGLVSRFGAGYDTVDAAACARHGVWLANSPDYGVGEVATHALAMALALLRHLPSYDHDVRAGNWHYLSPGRIRRASALTVGILGLGRIGKRFAHLARNTFGRVVACDPYIIDGDFPAYVERVTLQQLFDSADVISLHVPLTVETRGMVGGALLARARPGTILVNTARGAVVDVDALLQALDSGPIAAAGLDVLPTEPLPAEHALARHPRVLLTPHAAFYSIEAEVELRRKAALNIVQWAQQGRPAYCVVQGTRTPAGSH
jgi:D-3-phosphoglycerate dehydrogenase